MLNRYQSQDQLHRITFRQPDGAVVTRTVRIVSEDARTVCGFAIVNGRQDRMVMVDRKNIRNLEEHHA